MKKFLKDISLVIAISLTLEFLIWAISFESVVVGCLTGILMVLFFGER